MAERLDPKQLVEFKELLMFEIIQLEALTNLTEINLDKLLNNQKDRCMKTCSNFGQPIQENDMKNAAEILGELQKRRTGEFDEQNLCQACKEELGMLSLMGFGE